MNQQSNRLGQITFVDSGDGADSNGGGGDLADTDNPVLQPPKDPHAKPKKTWERNVIVWSMILLLIGAGVGALHLLLRVKRVNITVNADARRKTQSTKPQSELTNSDSALT